MRTTRTPTAPRPRRPQVAGIRRPRPGSTAKPAVEPVADRVVQHRVVDNPLVEDGTVDDGVVEDGTVDGDSAARAGGVADAVGEDGAVDDDTAAGRPDGDRDDEARPRAGVRLPIVLLIAAALLVAGGVWALARADRLAAESNVALVDTAGTAEVTRQVREGLEKIFSYRHDDTAATEAAAHEVLTGAASEQYDRLFRQVREQAPAQELALATRVVASGVVSLRGETAVLLVFLDQSAVRGDTGEVTTAGAQLSVTAVLTDGKWRISELVPR